MSTSIHTVIVERSFHTTVSIVADGWREAKAGALEMAKAGEYDSALDEATDTKRYIIHYISTTVQRSSGGG